MPRRLLASLTALLLLGGGVSACADHTGARPRTTPETHRTTRPPTPAEKLGLEGGWGPTTAELDQAARQVAHLPLRRLAGQVVVARYIGTQPPVDMVRRLHLGGVITFSDNVISPAQVGQVNRTLRRRVHRPWPLLIGVDQEGGLVARVNGTATRFPDFMSAGAADDGALTRRVYAASGAELAGMGFNLDFAPDADVTAGPDDPVIGSRSASSFPRLAARQVLAAARGYLHAGILPVVKHFPGHGSVTADSHLTLPVQHRSLARLESSDLVPFRAAIRAGLPAVMAGHLDVRAVGPRVPASVSRKVITGLLRERLGFEGVVTTDALNMQAITQRYTSAEAAVTAIKAGADVLLMPDRPKEAVAGLVRAVHSGRVDRRRLEQAAARVIALLQHQRTDLKPVTRAPGSAKRLSRRFSARAITVTAGPCRSRLVGSTVSPSGDAAAVSTFTAAARRAGLTVLLPASPPADLTASAPAPTRGPKEPGAAFQKRMAAWRSAEDRRRAELRSWQEQESARLAQGTSIGFSGYGTGVHDGHIAVAVNSPFPLASVGAPVRIATYGDTPGAMDALVAVLLGRATAPGRLPVPLPGQRTGCPG